jgi:ATP-dependent Clp protease adaptor protein ClpS
MANKQQDGGCARGRESTPQTASLFKVLLLNDDYTPMDFVVVVLQTVFAMSGKRPRK